MAHEMVPLWNNFSRLVHNVMTCKWNVGTEQISIPSVVMQPCSLNWVQCEPNYYLGLYITKEWNQFVYSISLLELAYFADTRIQVCSIPASG